MAKGRARDLAKEAAWRRRLARHADSGQGVRAWCRRHRVKEADFHRWRRELARRDAEVRGSSFMPVKVIDDPAQDGHGQIDIEFTDGRRVRVTGTVNRETLTDVLAVLTSANAAETERRSC